jgi:hypothetical protein
MDKPIPNHLAHTPLIKVEQYNHKDGTYAPHETDAKGISIGLASWAKNEISLKVWRHTNQMWSRQGEELPWHRPIDLTILLLSSVTKAYDVNSSPSNLAETGTAAEFDQLSAYFNNNPLEKEKLKERITDLQKAVRAAGVALGI